MKKICLLAAAAILLCGCAVTPTFETLADAYAPDEVQPKQIYCVLPEDAASPAIQNQQGKLYLCDGYEITQQTMAAENLDQTLKNLTGFGEAFLTVMETQTGELTRYECVWTAAGEGGDAVGRAAVLSDGSFHYCMSVMAPQEKAPQFREVWQALFDSFTLTD